MQIHFIYFQIIIEALQRDGSGSEGSISLDDLSILPHECPKTGDCDFFSSTCGYEDVFGPGTTKFQWLLGKGKTHKPDVIVGPTTGSTIDGMYAYVDFTTDGAKNNDLAQMRSPALPTAPLTLLLVTQ